MRPHDEASLRAHIDACPMGDTLSEQREGFIARAGVQPSTGTWTTIGGIDTLRVGAASAPALVWFHGGGYVLGSPDTHRVMAAHLASRDVQVLLPAYPCAPECTWPAPLNAALAVLDDLDNSVALGGDSAGGHLALNAALARPGRARALALISPNTDRTGSCLTRDRDGDAMNDGAKDAALWAMVAPELGDDDPQASPHLADLRGLSPLHVEAVGTEILLDDTLILTRAAAAAGVQVSAHIAPGLMHMHALWPDALPQGAEALDRIARHIHAASP
ncbi:alpha/beta hydrolase fold domain-containing protein [Pontivivens nitratireducens]|uniref:Alpha/beta hydrolase n=1 Tax=Pontivivens nitratireducens TaxID=2758038 RepID=A0A6G7VN37_9RHOB|nr:alpha/beta hydrolase fold domain-containing protein [Pontibrevibacter nitratireducens]QIK41459.1 alpha/beta hydrolase [Pontibrevibacter nitratireducens]